MLSIILINFSQGAFPLSAVSTLRTLLSRAAEDCGLTRRLWMSLSSFITLDRFSQNSRNRSRYSPITSSWEETTPCSYCSLVEFSWRRRWNSAGVGSGSGCAVSLRERCSSVRRWRASASCQFQARICYSERVYLCMFECDITIEAYTHTPKENHSSSFPPFIAHDLMFLLILREWLNCLIQQASDRGMLLPYLKVLQGKKVILGSQSKSRNQLMTAQRITYTVIPSKFEEDLDKDLYEGKPEKYNMDTCRGKVEELLSRFRKEGLDWDLLICGDTILEHHDKIIEKPENEKHCIEMMGGLSDSTHRVHTAHTVVFNPDKWQHKFRKEWVATAEVTFGEIPLNVLQYFAKEPEPYRHSGGYELTAMSGSFLKSINGSHSAVQGLDMHEVCRAIIEGGRHQQWWQ